MVRNIVSYLAYGSCWTNNKILTVYLEITRRALATDDKTVHKEETWDCCQYNTAQVRLQEPPAQQGIFIMALKCPGYWWNQLKLLNKCFLEKGQNIRRESNPGYV